MLLTPSPECPPRPTPGRQNNSHAAPQLKSTRGQCLKISPNPIKKKKKNVWFFLVVSDKFEINMYFSQCILTMVLLICGYLCMFIFYLTFEQATFC